MLSSGGVGIYTNLFVCHVILALVYIISLKILIFSKNSWISIIFISSLSILGVLQHEMWILVAFPIIVAISYDKKFTWSQISILVIPTLIAFFFCVKFGNIDESLTSFHQKFISLYPNLKIDYKQPSNWEINPWKKSPNQHSIFEFFQYCIQSLNGIYLVICVLIHLVLLFSLLKNLPLLKKFLFFAAISSSLLMFFLGVDYGRWVVCFSLNIFFFGLYRISKNEKLRIHPFLILIICFFCLFEFGLILYS